MSDRNVSPDSGQHWADEGAWPAAPGVHRIPLPLPTDGLRAVNVYAIETDEGLTLVDGGWAIEAGRAALDKGLAQVGYAASDIRRFLVTHVHRDHYTQAVVVRREFGSRIALGLADKPTLDRVHEGTDDNRIAVLLHDAGAADLADRWVRLVDGPGPDLSHWGYPDEWLEDDVDLAVGARTLRAVATPGHTRGHYVFADFSHEWSSDPPLGRGSLLAAEPAPGGEPWPWRELVLGNGETLNFITGIGEDAAGELYLMVREELGPEGTTGRVLRIIPPR